MNENDVEDFDSQADELIKAALGGDRKALMEVARHLREAEDDEDEPDPQTAPAGFTLHRYEDETREHAVANAAIRPTTLAAAAEHSLLRYGKILHEELTLDGLAEVLREQVRAVTDKKLDRGTGMLAAQAHTLDAIYNVLLRKALSQQHAPYLEMLFRTALRAQSQCRATWEAIATIQRPPAPTNQTNIANFDALLQLLVNNTDASEKPIPPNKLLEQTTHEPDKWLDRGAPATAASGDPAVEAVGTIHRSQDNEGKI